MPIAKLQLGDADTRNSPSSIDLKPIDSLIKLLNSLIPKCPAATNV